MRSSKSSYQHDEVAKTSSNNIVKQRKETATPQKATPSWSSYLREKEVKSSQVIRLMFRATSVQPRYAISFLLQFTDNWYYTLTRTPDSCTLASSPSNPRQAIHQPSPRHTRMSHHSGTNQKPTFTPV
ncbi:unnamed protein product [Protopolystoma xenopodis]|uniref:Uncharacterized protein n=1 Tax=Protopolystoma xenopodis TaxID=117903 RepID=A0A3S5C6Q1_9PLAT|nr:unnamed protein product [Protopolystoma xenopodis]